MAEKIHVSFAEMEAAIARLKADTGAVNGHTDAAHTAMVALSQTWDGMGAEAFVSTTMPRFQTHKDKLAAAAAEMIKAIQQAIEELRQGDQQVAGLFK